MPSWQRCTPGIVLEDGARRVGLAADVVAAVTVRAGGRDAQAALDEGLPVDAVPEQIDDVADLDLAALDDFFVAVAQAARLEQTGMVRARCRIRRRLDVVAAVAVGAVGRRRAARRPGLRVHAGVAATALSWHVAHCAASASRRTPRPPLIAWQPRGRPPIPRMDP
jgi:hypothetical protein